MFHLLSCYSILPPDELTCSSLRERQVSLCYLMLCITSTSSHCKAPVDIYSMSTCDLRHFGKPIWKKSRHLCIMKYYSS